MRQWNEWLFDGRVCLSAEQPSPGALVKVGWAIRNSTDDGKDNKKKARMIAAGRRDSRRALFIRLPEGGKLNDAVASEIQKLFIAHTWGQVLTPKVVRQFCSNHRIATWMLPLLGVK